MLLTKIKEFLNKKQNERLTVDFNNAVAFKRAVNMEVTMTVLSNYLICDQLLRTGLLYQPSDKYIKLKAQSLFLEWKNEGLINEFEDFEDTTKSLIMAYA